MVCWARCHAGEVLNKRPLVDRPDVYRFSASARCHRPATVWPLLTPRTQGSPSIPDARDKSRLVASKRVQFIEQRRVFRGAGRARMPGLPFCPSRHRYRVWHRPLSEIVRKGPPLVLRSIVWAPDWMPSGFHFCKGGVVSVASCRWHSCARCVA